MLTSRLCMQYKRAAAAVLCQATNAAYWHPNHLLTCWAGGTTNATLPTTRKAANLATAKIKLLGAIVLWSRLRSARTWDVIAPGVCPLLFVVACLLEIFERPSSQVIFIGRPKSSRTGIFPTAYILISARSSKFAARSPEPLGLCWC